MARPLARQVFNFDNYDLAQARGGRGSRRGGSQGAREPGSQEAKAELQTPNSVRSGGPGMPSMPSRLRTSKAKQNCRSPGASTRAEDSPGDLHGASTRTYQISHIICGEYKAVSVMTNDWHVTELCQYRRILLKRLGDFLFATASSYVLQLRHTTCA